jgi:AbrB family looped-hinge helix DNA binding protein
MKTTNDMKVRMSARGQIVIPVALRRKYGIKGGTRIIVTDIGNAVVLKPITGQYLRTLQGSLKGKGGMKVLLGERRKDRERK